VPAELDRWDFSACDPAADGVLVDGEPLGRLLNGEQAMVRNGLHLAAPIGAATRGGNRTENHYARRVEDPEYRRLGDTMERLISFSALPGDESLIVWDSLTVREQRMVAHGLASMVAHLRAERGDPPGSEYGPE
jgi:hypothetical protein